MTNRKKVIIDFDGTIVDFRYPEVGNPKPGVKKALEIIREMGFIIQIHSCRTSFAVVDSDEEKNKHKKLMEDVLNKYKIPYDEIIMDFDKPLAHVYIDDRGIGFRNDWNKVIEELNNF